MKTETAQNNHEVDVLCRTEEGHASHLPFERKFFRDNEGRYAPEALDHDLRKSIPGLEDYPEPLLAQDVVIDSDMSLHQAFHKLSSHCPDEILVEQQLIGELYFSDDKKLHYGQVVIHKDLVNDVLTLFQELRRLQIPIHSMAPLAQSDFHKDGSWDDVLSMEANNASAFNYRRMLTPTGEKKRLSLHALGLALDINPAWNPAFGDPEAHTLEYHEKECAAGYKEKLPQNGVYDLTHAGTFHDRHHVVVLMESMGWTWGGRWGEPKDYHHFQKIPDKIAEWAQTQRNS